MSGKAREYHLRLAYGISLEQYDELFQRQDGRCAICFKCPDKEGQSLSVDHNHKTGEIRGLLCRYCNYRLVGRHTDADLLRRVAEYLDRRTGWFVPEKKIKKRKRRGKKS